MTLVVLSVVAATVLGLAFRGSFTRLGQPATRRNGLIAFGALSLCTVFFAKHPSVWAGWMAAGAVALIVYARLNRGRPGLALMAAGMLLNVLVIALNSSMPLSLDAAERAGVPDSRLAESDPLREPLVDDTRLPWIGETVPLALPVRPDVASPGDLLVAAGAAVFMFTGLTGRGRPRPEPPKKRRGRRARNRKQAAEAPEQTAEIGEVSGATVDGSLAAAVGATGVASAVARTSAAAGGAATAVAERDPFTGGRLRHVSADPVERTATAVEVLPVAVPDPVTPPEFGPLHGSGRASTVTADTSTVPAPASVTAVPSDATPAADPATTRSVDTQSVDTRSVDGGRTRTGSSAKRRAAAGRHAAPPSGRRVAGRPARSTNGSHAVGESAGAGGAARQSRQRSRRGQDDTVDPRGTTDDESGGSAPSGPPAAWNI